MLHRYIEICPTEWVSAPEAKERLFLGGGKEMIVATWAGTTVYKVEGRALTRLWNAKNDPQDYKVTNLQVLKDRILAVGGGLFEKSDPRGHPAYRGGKVRRAPEISEEEEVSQQLTILKDTNKVEP